MIETYEFEVVAAPINEIFTVRVVVTDSVFNVFVLTGNDKYEVPVKFFKDEIHIAILKCVAEYFAKGLHEELDARKKIKE